MAVDRALAFLGPLLLGCATGPPAAGLAAGLGEEYGGEPYLVRRGAGRISGQVCGNDVLYDILPAAADAALISGFVDSQRPSRLELRKDEGGGERISGMLDAEAGAGAVDLRLTPEALEGRVGFRRFQLHRDGDALTGEGLIRDQSAPGGTDLPSPVRLTGVAALWALPAAVRAAVLPNTLSCFVAPIGALGRSALQIRFGGRPGAQPRGSSGLP